MLTTIPFAGFYGSVHDAEIDDALDMLFQNENGDKNEALTARFFDLVNFTQVHQTYARNYCAALAEEFSIALEFESMTSPRFYNFETDKIFATISEAEVWRLFEAVDKKRLDEVAAERHTSRSGFFSFYNPDWRTWPDLPAWDHNQVGTLVIASIDAEFFEDSWPELELMSGARENGNLDEWLFEAAEKGAKLDRIEKVYRYLRDREERR